MSYQLPALQDIIATHPAETDVPVIVENVPILQFMQLDITLAPTVLDQVPKPQD